MNWTHEMVAAYVDGELDLIATKRLEKAMESDAALVTMVEKEMALRATLTAHFAPILDEPVPDRLTAMVAASSRIDNSLAARREARSGPRQGWSLPVQWTAIAASLAIGLFGGVLGSGVAFNDAPGNVTTNGDQFIASGALASALDTQLAATQGSAPNIRIGTSFADANGQYCRTFESATVDGIACKDNGNWQLRQTMSGSDASDYRQASSGALADAAAAMMAGQPLDANAEKAARDRGWQSK